jgi:hypothetical protein
MDDFSQTELDTFKILSNSDMVDWSRRAPELRRTEEWGGYEEREQEAAALSGTVIQEEILPSASPYITKEYRRDVSKTPPLPRSPPPRSRSPSPKREVFVEVEEPRHSPEQRRPEPKLHRDSESEDYARRSVSPESKPMPKRVMPQPKKYTAAEENDDYEIKAEKEGILQELFTFSKPPHNIKMTREWDVNVHTLDELQYELDRINSEQSANGIVDMAKSGIKFGVSGLEMFLKNQGIDSVDGWYNNSCKDMSKFNRPLLRLYKKYWRNTNLSPTMELGYLLMGSLVWTVAQNKMGFNGKPAQSEQPASEKSAPKMRPPSNSSFGGLPKWGSESAPASVPSPPPVPIVVQTQASVPTEIEKELLAKQKSTDETLQKLSSENALMIQMLQSLAKTHVPTPKQSPRSSAKNSPREIRLPMGKRSAKKTPRVNLLAKDEEEDSALSL